MECGQMAAVRQEVPVQEETGKKGISGSTIKIIAVVTMLIDHIAAVVLTRVLIDRGLYEVAYMPLEQRIDWLNENGTFYYVMYAMRMIGRLGFPLFCFLLVEGFQKTRSVGKYAMRLGIFALISEIPFDLATSGKVFSLGYQSVYFTLLIGILALWGFDYFAKHDLKKGLQSVFTAGGILLLPGYAAFYMYSLLKELVLQLFGISLADLLGGQNTVYFLALGMFLAFLVLMVIAYAVYRHMRGSDRAWRMAADMTVLAVAMFAADMLRTDYAGIGVVTIAAMYVFRERRVISMLAGCIALAGVSLLSFNTTEIPAFLALIPVALYNGKRGLKMKYFFYAFYPVHLFLLWLVALLMGLGWISAI